MQHFLYIVTHFELRITHYELCIMHFKLRITHYELDKIIIDISANTQYNIMHIFLISNKQFLKRKI